MKKFLCILLAGAMLFSVACNKDEPEENASGGAYDETQGIDKENVVTNIVENGVSAYKIVLPDETDECLDYAGRELQRYIEEVSGARLPVVKESAAGALEGMRYISLGQTKLFADCNFNVDFSALNYVGYVMKQLGNALYIAADGSEGVLYGVYDFCEQVLGIRFLTPEATYMEEKPTVPLYAIDRTEVPAFAGRDYMARQSMRLKDFTARLKMNSTYGEVREQYGNGGRGSYYAGDGHTNLETMLPPDEYGKDHPDWYNSAKTELCYTNGITDEGTYDENAPDSMVNGMLARCKEIILANTTNAKYIMLGQPDNSAWCTCDRCRASDAKYGKSGTLMIFINTVAEQLEKWKEENGIDKEINVATFAYWKTIAPPTKVENGELVLRDEKVKARDNVVIKIAHMSCNYHALFDENCTTNAEFRSYFEGWSLVTDRFLIWDYATNFRHHFFWYPNFNSLKENYLYYQSIGAEGVMTQGAPHEYRYYQGHLENYIVSKLLWNPNRDVNALVEEFNAYYFGDSAAVVNEFVSRMNYHYATLGGENHSFHTELYDTLGFLYAENHPKGLLEAMMDLIETEMERVENSDMSAVDKEERNRRLLEVYIMPQYMYLYNYETYADPTTKRDYAVEFFRNTDKLGIEYYGEGTSIASLKQTYSVS